jgi:hypothetical protein
VEIFRLILKQLGAFYIFTAKKRDFGDFPGRKSESRGTGTWIDTLQAKDYPHPSKQRPLAGDTECPQGHRDISAYFYCAPAEGYFMQ